jgi:hypothetical protein
MIKHNTYFYCNFEGANYKCIIEDYGISYAVLKIYLYQKNWLGFKFVYKIISNSDVNKKNVYDATEIKTLCVQLLKDNFQILNPKKR